MPGQYKQIALDDACAGMVLSDDLLDSRGKVLLKQGLVLTESTLAALQRHQVEVLSIVCENENAPVDAETEREQHSLRLDRLFRKPGDSAVDATGLLEQTIRCYRLGDTQ